MPKQIFTFKPNFSVHPFQTHKFQSNCSLSTTKLNPQTYNQQNKKRLDKLDDFFFDDGDDQDIQIDETPFIYMCKMSKKITKLRTTNNRLRHYHKDMEAKLKTLLVQNEALKSRNYHKQNPTMMGLSNQANQYQIYQPNLSQETLTSSIHESKESSDNLAPQFTWISFDHEQSIFLDDQIHKISIIHPVPLQQNICQKDQASMKGKQRNSALNDVFSQNGSSLCTISEQNQQSDIKNIQKCSKQFNCDESKNQDSLNLQKEDKNDIIPKGIILVREDTVAIWRSQQIDQIIQYLKSNKNIKKVIIHNEQFATQINILNIIQNIPTLIGLYYYCDMRVEPQAIEASNLSYYSFFPNYSHLDQFERAKHFPRSALSFYIQLEKKKKYQYYIFQLFSAELRNKTIYLEQLPFLKNNDAQQLNIVSLKTYKPSIVFHHQLFISKMQSLQILSLSRIFLPYKVSFQLIFRQNCYLHTLALDKCAGNQEKIVYELKLLRKDQLNHLMLSGDELNRKISLTQSTFDQLMKHAQLKTLILQNVQFFKRKANENDRRYQLNNIPQLTNLVHLNLFGSQNIMNRICQFLNGHHDIGIQILNIGNTRLNNRAISFFSKLHQVKRLCLNYCQIQTNQIINLTKDMDKLEQLSLQKINGMQVDTRKESIHQNKGYYGAITPQLLNKIHYRNIKYLNIYGCSQLINYGFEQFQALQCIIIQKGVFLQDKIHKMKKQGVEVIQKNEINRKSDQQNKIIIKQLQESEQNILMEACCAANHSERSARQLTNEDDEIRIIQKHKWKCYLMNRLS